MRHEIALASVRERLETLQASIAADAASAGRIKEPFNDAELDKMVKFLDPSGDGIIEYPELLDGVMRARRQKAEEKAIKEGKAAMRTFIARLAQIGLTVREWFDAMDGCCGARSDGNVTFRELRLGLSRTEAETGVCLLRDDDTSTSELMQFVRYIDTSGENDLTYEEVSDALAKLDSLTEAEQLGEHLGDIFERFEHAIKGMRLLGFFRVLDKDRSGSVSTAELRDELAILMQPEGKVRAQLKMRMTQMQKLIDQKAARDERAMVACKHMLHMEVTGAGEVLRRLSERVKERGLKLTQLFFEIDQSGDGSIDGHELAAMLKRLTMPSTEVMVVLARREREYRKSRLADEKARVDTQRERERMAHAESTGAFQALKALAALLTAEGPRVQTLYQPHHHTTTDGLVDVDELRTGLARGSMPRESVAKMVEHLDTSGDGQLDVAEPLRPCASCAASSGRRRSALFSDERLPPRCASARSTSFRPTTLCSSGSRPTRCATRCAARLLVRADRAADDRHDRGRARGAPARRRLLRAQRRALRRRAPSPSSSRTSARPTTSRSPRRDGRAKSVTLAQLHEWLTSLKEPEIVAQFNERGWTRERAEREAAACAARTARTARGPTRRSCQGADRAGRVHGPERRRHRPRSHARPRSRRRNARQLMEGGARAVLAQLCQALRTDPSSAASGVVAPRRPSTTCARAPPTPSAPTRSARSSRAAGDGPKLGDKAIKVVLRFLDPTTRAASSRASSSAASRSRTARRAPSSSTSTRSIGSRATTRGSTRSGSRRGCRRRSPTRTSTRW